MENSSKNTSNPKSKSTKAQQRALVLKELAAFVLEQKRIPEVEELAKTTQLSEGIVIEILKKAPPSSLKSTMRHLTQMVMVSIFEKALSGAAANQKLWLQLFENWVAPQQKVEASASDSFHISIAGNAIEKSDEDK